MQSIDITLFWIAFFCYFAGFLFYTLFLTFKKDWWAKLGLGVMVVGLIPQTAGFILRWFLAEHIPLSNMYEYMGLMSWMAVVGLILIVWRYQKPMVGGLVSAGVFMLMVTASILPKEINQSLMPALQSYWLYIHVSLAALGSGSFAVACVISFIYLLKNAGEAEASLFNPKSSISNMVLGLLLFPLLFAIIAKLAGILPKTENLNWITCGLGLALPLGALLWTFLHHRQKHLVANLGVGIFSIYTIVILVAGLITGLLIKYRVIFLLEQSAWKLFDFLGWVLVIGWFVFLPLYWLIGVKGLRFFRSLNVNIELLDEINYKAISLGYPLYTIGALFAGAIWAEKAWGQFWSWDPKEVGALIIWLFYTGYFHARRQKNWQGNRAAILSILGLLMILLSFFGNYFFGGQHAYT